MRRKREHTGIMLIDRIQILKSFLEIWTKNSVIATRQPLFSHYFCFYRARDGGLTIQKPERLFFSFLLKTANQNSTFCLLAQTSQEYVKLYESVRNTTRYGYNSYHTFGYDTIWSVALALNNSIPYLAKLVRPINTFA